MRYINKSKCNYKISFTNFISLFVMKKDSRKCKTQIQKTHFINYSNNDLIKQRISFNIWVDLTVEAAVFG